MAEVVPAHEATAQERHSVGAPQEQSQSEPQASGNKVVGRTEQLWNGSFIPAGLKIETRITNWNNARELLNSVEQV
jgi:hypothetical protein